ncbi:Down syndrome cell adhesion molecule-like protein Dscam2 [Nymphon striatum]|nr:Down syndrome cell adhesion molecule-like protein Dscam2 [Nymphon striatum]
MIDGSVLATTDRRRVYANGTIFIIDADRARDSGRYSCIAKNRQGQSASGERYLIVIDKPVLSDIKFPEGVAEGMRVNVLCNILKGEQPVTKAWLKDGHPIASDIGIVITHTSSFSILNIENVRRHHAGTYICSARNSAGQTNKTGRLIVQASPEWAIKPEDQLAAEGSLIILECQGNGYPKPTIKWSKSRYGKSVPVYESGRIEKLINGSLMIRYARKSDQGVYTCEVSNSIPPNLYAKVQVTVGLSPRVFINTARKKVAIGNSTVLKCKAEGDPVLRVEWTNDNQEPLRSQDRFKLISNYRETERTLDLELKKALRSDSEPPSSVQNISILNARNYTIQLSWQKPKYDGASEIIKYVVLYESEPDGVKEVEVNLQKNEMKDNRIKIGGMTPEVQYKLWMVATNKIGSSSNSPFHLFRFAHNGTLILSTGTASRHPGVMPNLMLLLVIPSVVIVLILVVVIIVVFLLLRRSRKRQQASKRINRQSLVLEAKSTEEQMYKNVGLMAELKDKQSERYGKIQSEAGSRYQPLSIGDYKRFSAIELYAATSESGNYSEVSPYATSCLPDSSSSANKKVEMKTFAMPIYYGETGVTAFFQGIGDCLNPRKPIRPSVIRLMNIGENKLVDTVALIAELAMKCSVTWSKSLVYVPEISHVDSNKASFSLTGSKETEVNYFEVYKTVIRPVLLYRCELWAVRKWERDMIERTEMRMLRWMFGIKRLDRVKNGKTYGGWGRKPREYSLAVKMEQPIESKAFIIIISPYWPTAEQRPPV